MKVRIGAVMASLRAGCSADVIRRAANAGELPGVKELDRWFFERDVVDAWAEARGLRKGVAASASR